MTLKVTAMEVLRIVLYDYALPNNILSTTKYYTILKVRTGGIFCTDFFLVLFCILTNLEEQAIKKVQNDL